MTPRQLSVAVTNIGRASSSEADDALHRWLEQFVIVCVIPTYNVEREIGQVLAELPAYIRYAVVVDDASTDRTVEIVGEHAARDRRIVLVRHATNQGVGGAMRTGFQRALSLGAQLVVKVDGDGQMDMAYVPALLLPLIQGEADYAKGNRFRNFKALRQMPPIRRAGNMALSFLVKGATGYWKCFDPTNGFVAIRADVLAQLDLSTLHQSYFFEISMLGHLNQLNAVVLDVAMPARYGDETSNLSIRRVIREFPGRLAGCLVRRIALKHFIYDFTMEAVYLLTGLPLLLAGALYGGINWVLYVQKGIGAPTGTVVISALLVVLGFQLLLGAVELDLHDVPQKPLSKDPLEPAVAGPALITPAETRR
jgi:glycosyltransferase involved in cell wall biosynthesis